MIKAFLPKFQTILISASTSAFSVTALAKTDMSYMIPKGKGTYLQEDFVLPLNKARLDIRDNAQGRATASLDYRLPQELDGAEPKRFRPSGTKRADGSWFLTEQGKDGNGNTINIVEAVCTGNEEDFSCRMEYAKNSDEVFALNLEAARDYLASRSDLSSDQIAKIEGAQMTLSHEAIGIVKAKKKRHGGRD